MLRNEIDSLRIEKDRAIQQMELIEQGVKDVKKIKAVNAVNPDDVIKRLHEKGYFRSE